MRQKSVSVKGECLMLIYETFSDFFSWVCSMPDKRLIEELHYLESLIDDSVICESILADIVFTLYRLVCDEIVCRFSARVKRTCDCL